MSESIERFLSRGYRAVSDGEMSLAERKLKFKALEAFREIKGLKKPETRGGARQRDIEEELPNEGLQRLMANVSKESE
jgi:hypothetical protein